MSLRDANEHLTLRVPSLGTLATVCARAVTLRCPRCGGRPVLASWFALRERCARCDQLLHRGEADYFLGGMLLNLGLAEGLFVVGLAAVLWARWPAVPWHVLQYAAPVGMLIAPILTYPISRLMWLGLDLAVRPSIEQ